jgi:hypothetical protein
MRRRKRNERFTAETGERKGKRQKAKTINRIAKRCLIVLLNE